MTGPLPPEASGPALPPEDGAPALASRRAGIHVLAFGAGFAVMAIELAGARVIAPVFGLSAVPWTAVIGVILSALALGNHLGGRWADAGRVPLAVVLAAAGATAALPVVGAEVPWWAAARLGFIGGALASAAVLFAPSVLALGAVVPYLVRADTRSLDTVGRRAGDVGAAATVGSIAGTFATGFLLLPYLPLPLLLAAVAAGLFGLAALAAFVLREELPPAPLVAAAALAAALGLTGWSAAPPGVLHREETIHGSVRVTERVWPDGRLVRELWQNGGSSSAEEVETGRPAHAYARASLDLLEGVAPRLDSALVLGGGALTLPVALTRRFPDLEVHVVELDPVATLLAGRYFAYGKAEPEARLAVYHDDARLHLRTHAARYDLIYLDVFDHLVTVPWTLVTAEALAGMRARLTDDGFVMANVLSPIEGGGAAFLRRFMTTLELAFGTVRAYLVSPELDEEATQNVLILAASSPAHLPPAAGVQVVLPAEGPPLTDAHAPVEYLQARVFLEGLRWR